MSKRSAIVIIALVLCLVLAQGVFAEGKVYPNEYKIFEVKGEEENYYSLAEAYWFNPTVYSVEVLEFLQAYLSPDDPVSFYMDAAQFSNEDIDQYVVIFQSFLEPEYVGAIPFEYRCDIEALSEFLGYDLFDPEGRYELTYYFEDPHFLVQLFPRGIGRANAYDIFRRCALHLACYTAVNGITPGSLACYDYIQTMIAYYEEQFNEAMEAEALAEAERENGVQEGAEENQTEAAPQPEETNNNN